MQLLLREQRWLNTTLQPPLQHKNTQQYCMQQCPCGKVVDRAFSRLLNIFCRQIDRQSTEQTQLINLLLGPDGLCFFSGLLFYSFILRSFTYYSFHPAHYSLIILTTIYSTYYINVRKLYNTKQYNLLDCNIHNCK